MQIDHEFMKKWIFFVALLFRIFATEYYCSKLLQKKKHSCSVDFVKLLFSFSAETHKLVTRWALVDSGHFVVFSFIRQVPARGKIWILGGITFMSILIDLHIRIFKLAKVINWSIHFLLKKSLRKELKEYVATLLYRMTAIAANVKKWFGHLRLSFCFPCGMRILQCFSNFFKSSVLIIRLIAKNGMILLRC